MSEQKLKFKKLSGKYDGVEFWIDSNKLVEIQNPKQRIIAHDMVHYAIESSFPFEGFIKLVFAGHEPGRIIEVLENVSPKLEYSQTSWITESLAKSMQAALWSETFSFEDFEYAYKKACDARKIEPAKIHRADFEACRKLVASLTHKWENLKVGDSLELPYRSKSRNIE